MTIVTMPTTKFILTLFALALLVSCGTSKSTEVNTTTLSSNDNVNYIKPLANCSKSVNADISMSINAILDSQNTADPNWVKIKFNFLSAAVTTAGNTVRFFKWQAAGSQPYLEPTPLTTLFYDSTSGQPITNPTTSIPVTELPNTRGMYLQLNDPESRFQVLKAVVYNTEGKIVAQLNSLIPQFNSNPNDYKLNSDGSVRSQILTAMHPLATTNTANWSVTEFSNYFQAFCF